MTYQTVTNELERGTPPELLCATCPWDRLCITPPTMTKAEIDRQIKQASEPSAVDVARGKDSFAGTLVAAMLYAGKDTSAQVCPVFAMRLSSPDGRAIADGVRHQMRDWQPGEPAERDTSEATA